MVASVKEKWNWLKVNCVWFEIGVVIPLKKLSRLDWRDSLVLVKMRIPCRGERLQIRPKKVLEDDYSEPAGIKVYERRNPCQCALILIKSKYCFNY